MENVTESLMLLENYLETPQFNNKICVVISSGDKVAHSWIWEIKLAQRN